MDIEGWFLSVSNFFSSRKPSPRRNRTSSAMLLHHPISPLTALLQPVFDRDHVAFVMPSLVSRVPHDDHYPFISDLLRLLDRSSGGIGISPQMTLFLLSPVEGDDFGSGYVWSDAVPSVSAAQSHVPDEAYSSTATPS